MTFLMVLTASLLGSPHCAAMCGGIVACYSANSTKTLIPHLLYNGARGLAYCLVGALAGLVGQSIDTVGAVAGIQEFAPLLMGAMLLVWGIAKFLNPEKTTRITPSERSAPIAGFLSRQYKRLFESEILRTWRPAFFGAFSIFLPCGWLYAYVAVAAASGSPAQGALLMLAFWIGTLPVLLSVGGLGSLFGRVFGKYTPKVGASLLVVAGLFSIGTALGYIQLMDHSQHGENSTKSTAQHCHH